MTTDKPHLFALCIDFNAIKTTSLSVDATTKEAVIFYVPAESEKEAQKRLALHLQATGFRLLNVQWCVDHDNLPESTEGLVIENVALQTAREQNRIVREPALDDGPYVKRSE